MLSTLQAMLSLMHIRNPVSVFFAKKHLILIVTCTHSETLHFLDFSHLHLSLPYYCTPPPLPTYITSLAFNRVFASRYDAYNFIPLSPPSLICSPTPSLISPPYPAPEQAASRSWLLPRYVSRTQAETTQTELTTKETLKACDAEVDKYVEVCSSSKQLPIRVQFNCKFFQSMVGVGHQTSGAVGPIVISLSRCPDAGHAAILHLDHAAFFLASVFSICLLSIAPWLLGRNAN